MKKIIALFLCLVVISTAFVSCDEETLIVTPTDVIKISVSTAPYNEDYTRTIDSSTEISKVVGFINNMSVSKIFKENPDEYVGMTLVLEFYLSDNSQITVCAYYGMFLRIDNGPWLRMDNEEYNELKEMVLPKIG